jgi:hypothetical protein
MGADPAPRGPTAPQGEGGPLSNGGVGSPQKDRATLAYPSVTLSSEKAASRSRAWRHPRPAANAALEAAHGRPPAGSRLAPSPVA